MARANGGTVLVGYQRVNNSTQERRAHVTVKGRSDLHFFLVQRI